MDEKRESKANKLSEAMEKSIIRGVVVSLARGSVVLQNGDFITEEDIQNDRDFMRNYKFRYPSESKR